MKLYGSTIHNTPRCAVLGSVSSSPLSSTGCRVCGSNPFRIHTIDLFNAGIGEPLYQTSLVRHSRKVTLPLSASVSRQRFKPIVPAASLPHSGTSHGQENWENVSILWSSLSVEQLYHSGSFKESTLRKTHWRGVPLEFHRMVGHSMAKWHRRSTKRFSINSLLCSAPYSVVPGKGRCIDFVLALFGDFSNQRKPAPPPTLGTILPFSLRVDNTKYHLWSRWS